jgi:hypothetical protein
MLARQATLNQHRNPETMEEMIERVNPEKLEEILAPTL